MAISIRLTSAPRVILLGSGVKGWAK